MTMAAAMQGRTAEAPARSIASRIAHVDIVTDLEAYQTGPLVHRRPCQERLAEIGDEGLVPGVAPLGLGQVGQFDGGLEAQDEGATGEDGITQLIGGLQQPGRGGEPVAGIVGTVDRVVPDEEHVGEDSRVAQ